MDSLYVMDWKMNLAEGTEENCERTLRSKILNRNLPNTKQRGYTFGTFRL
jgi:hypothetical protein